MKDRASKEVRNQVASEGYICNISNQNKNIGVPRYYFHNVSKQKESRHLNTHTQTMAAAAFIPNILLQLSSKLMSRCIELRSPTLE